MTPATEQTPSQPPVGRDGLPENGGVGRRGSGRRWVAVVVSLFVVVAAASIWQAVEHRRVQGDLDAAASAFDAARDAHAREAAPESWQRAAEAMDLAMAELHRQRARFLLFRSYPRAHESLRKAIDAAVEAKTSAEAAFARAGNEGPQQPAPTAEGDRGTGGSAGMNERAREVIESAKASLARANASLARVGGCPRAMREIAIRTYVQKVRSNLEVVAGQVADIDAKFDKRDYFDATVAAETLKGKVEPFTKDLDGIATKFRCKKSP